MNKIGICGHFGFGKILLNGQTIKTKIISEEIGKQFGVENIHIVDTHGGRSSLFRIIFQLVLLAYKCENVIILPAHNGIRIMVPLLALINKVLYRKLHYVVIGGWLREFLQTRPRLVTQLKSFKGIYVETNTMKMDMKTLGFGNVLVMQNCKTLTALDPSELTYSYSVPYKLCTFSRVMKEKGIEDAIYAVQVVNEKEKRIVYTLDIYGQIDENYVGRFAEIRRNLPEFIQYKGVVPFDRSVAVLRNYYALLFPTYYDGEGLAGTILDAMASGLPIIASDWKYNRDIVINKVTGILFESKNKQELVKSLIWAKENNDIWNQMKLNCLYEYEQYRPEKVINVIIENLQ